MYYWATNKQSKVETALLQFLFNLDFKNSFVYWTIRAALGFQTGDLRCEKDLVKRDERLKQVYTHF